jgi:hypothetical protein
MKMLFNITFPTAAFNDSVRDGSAGSKLGRIMDATKPEVIYFTDHDGQRGAVAIVEVPNASSIPSLCEPWFLAFDAKVKVHIAMTPEDLQKSGLDSIGTTWG